MKIETTAMDDVWILIMTLSVLYLVVRAIATLERMSKKVDSMVDHIGSEVESAISKLSKEANGIIHNLEKNAFGCKENLFQHVQAMELQCYRTKNGIFAMGLGPRSSKKKLSPQSSAISAAAAAALKQSSVSAPVNSLCNPPADGSCTGKGGQKKKTEAQKQLMVIHKYVERILKAKYKFPFRSLKNKLSKKNSSASSASASPASSAVLVA